MKKLIFIAFTSILAIANLQAQNKKAAKYNNNLFRLQNDASNQIIKFFEVVKAGDIAKIQAAHTDVNKHLDEKIAEVSEFKAFEGDNSLKDAVLVWLKGYEESFENEYKLMLPLLAKKDRTEEENAKLNQMHDDLIKEEIVYDQQLTQTQKIFAEKHKLVLGDGN